MFDGLEGQLTDAVCKAYQRWRDEHPDEQLYAFGIATNEMAESAGEVAMSEQGLAAAAEKYLKRDCPDGNLNQLARELRWSAYDSPYCLQYEDLFIETNRRLEQIAEYTRELDPDDPAFQTHIEDLFSIFVKALNNFRVRALEGDQSVLLMVWPGDCGEDEFNWFLEQCNGPEVVSALYAWLEEVNE